MKIHNTEKIHKQSKHTTKDNKITRTMYQRLYSFFWKYKSIWLSLKAFNNTSLKVLVVTFDMMETI